MPISPEHVNPADYADFPGTDTQNHRFHLCFFLHAEGARELFLPHLKHDLFIAQVLPSPVFSYLFADFHQARQASSCLSFRRFPVLIRKASPGPPTPGGF